MRLNNLWELMVVLKEEEGAGNVAVPKPREDNWDTPPIPYTPKKPKPSTPPLGPKPGGNPAPGSPPPSDPGGTPGGDNDDDDDEEGGGGSSGPSPEELWQRERERLANLFDSLLPVQSPEMLMNNPEDFADERSEERISTFLDFVLGEDWQQTYETAVDGARDLFARAKNQQAQNQSFNYTPVLQSMSYAGNNQSLVSDVGNLPNFGGYIPGTNQSFTPDGNTASVMESYIAEVNADSELTDRTIAWLHENLGNEETGAFLSEDAYVLEAELRSKIAQDFQANFPELDSTQLQEMSIQQMLEVYYSESAKLYMEHAAYLFRPQVETRINNEGLISSQIWRTPEHILQNYIHPTEELYNTFLPEPPKPYEDLEALMTAFDFQDETEAQRYILAEMGRLNDYSLDPRWQDRSAVQMASEWRWDLRARVPSGWIENEGDYNIGGDFDYEDAIAKIQLLEGTYDYTPPDLTLLYTVAQMLLEPLDIAVTGIDALRDLSEGKWASAAVKGALAIGPGIGGWMLHQADDLAFGGGRGLIDPDQLARRERIASALPAESKQIFGMDITDHMVDEYERYKLGRFNKLPPASWVSNQTARADYAVDFIAEQVRHQRPGDIISTEVSLKLTMPDGSVKSPRLDITNLPIDELAAGNIEIPGVKVLRSSTGRITLDIGPAANLEGYYLIEAKSSYRGEVVKMNDSSVKSALKFYHPQLESLGMEIIWVTETGISSEVVKRLDEIGARYIENYSPTQPIFE